jgi:hypothetical protein
MKKKSYSKPSQEMMLPYDRLRFAIVKQAVDDYKTALRTKNPAKITECEKFFRSQWGQWLSGGSGVYIIEKCKQIVNKRHKV